MELWNHEKLKQVWEVKTREEEVEVLQRYINTGLAWRLEGSVGRAAMEAIRSGECILGEVAYTDAYGNRVPSRTEVEPGREGSVEYQNRLKGKRNDDQETL